MSLACLIVAQLITLTCQRHDPTIQAYFRRLLVVPSYSIMCRLAICVFSNLKYFASYKKV